MNNRENLPPVLWYEKKDCCGCAACEAVCPVDAISMRQDEEGFFYPYIDETICLRCRLCVRACGNG